MEKYFETGTGGNSSEESKCKGSKGQDSMAYSHLKNRLVMELLPREHNEEFLASVPHKIVEDLAIVYRIGGEGYDDDAHDGYVTNKMIQEYGISALTLNEDALKYAPRSHPAILRPVVEMLPPVLGVDASYFFPGMIPIWVATTDNNYKGAAVIFYPDFMKAAAEQLQSSYFVLPSSRHEMLIVPDNGERDYEEYSHMVRSINEMEVAPDDRLSDSVYYYDRDRLLFGLAEEML